MHPLPCYSAGSSTKDKTVIILLALLQLISTLKGSMGTGTNFTWFPMISYVSAGFLETYPYLLLQWGTASMHTFQISQGSSKNLRIFRNLLAFRCFFLLLGLLGFFVIFNRNLQIFEFTGKDDGTDVLIHTAQLLRLGFFKGAR